jgi:ATP-binding cassette, subfamily B, bacterial PglK
MQNAISGDHSMDLPQRSIASALRDLADLWQHVGGEKRRSRAVFLLGLMLLSMALEIIGVGTVFSVVSLMLSEGGGSLAQSQWAYLDRIMGTRAEQHVAIALIVLVLLFTLKAVLQAFVAMRIASFSYKLQADLARALYATYLKQPYEFHLVRNSEKLINTINNEARDAATAINSVLSLIAELFVALGLGLVLVSISPLIGIAIAAIAVGAGVIIIRQNRARLARWGQLMRDHQALKMQSLRQGFDGYKEISLRGFQDGAVASFDTHNIAHTNAGRHFVSLSTLPRLWMEWLGIVGFAAAALVLNTGSHSYQSLFPYLGMIAAAAFRLLPSLSRIVGGLQNLRYFAPTVYNVTAELKSIAAARPDATTTQIGFSHDIAFEAVCYIYPLTDAAVLDGFTTSISRGSLVGIVGPSGSGKTTFIDLVLGFIKPTQGSVMADGISIQTAMADWQRRIGYVPQSIFVMDDTLRRNIAFGIPDHQIDDDRVMEALRATQLSPGICNGKAGLDLHLGDRGTRLSGGQRQRVAIARALYQRPEILVVDEGTSALDAETEIGVMATLRALRGAMTVIVASHSANTLDGFDQIIQIGNGKAS